MKCSLPGHCGTATMCAYCDAEDRKRHMEILTERDTLKLQVRDLKLQMESSDPTALYGHWSSAQLALKAAKKDLDAANRLVRELQDILASALIDGDIDAHAENEKCPQDDTCTCKWAKKINEAMKGYADKSVEDLLRGPEKPVGVCGSDGATGVCMNRKPCYVHDAEKRKCEHAESEKIGFTVWKCLECGDTFKKQDGP